MTIGIDEVGRGCWAGPLVVAAVALNFPILGLADSKTLSASQRELLALQIRSKAEHISITWVPSRLVDQIGLSQAMRVACRTLYDELPVQPQPEIIIDGSVNYLPGTNAAAMVKADGTIPSVSAASIIAKVARDRYMHRISTLYPHYGFEQHVGYGTVKHRQAIETHGLCKLHRRSFRPIAALVESTAIL
jgi:ribonuclease HII